MRALLFNGNRIVTGDAIADAIVDYSAMLARAQRSDELELPVLVDGAVGRARLLLLPSVPLAWVSAEAGGGPFDGEDHEVATEIRARMRRLETEMWF